MTPRKGHGKEAHQSRVGLGGIRSLEDIRQRCVVEDGTGCWLWKGAVAGTTPSMRIAALEASVGAGVAICFFTTGRRPEHGVVWHRTCTTQLCVCPAHRQAGTRKTQMAFQEGIAIRPAHRARIAATKRARSRLTVELVEHIRSSEATGIAVAREVGISVSHACRIRRREAWHRTDGSVFGWRP